MLHHDNYVLIENKTRIGQAQFNILQQKGLDSACWRYAASSIGADCETMSHTRKQRLAVQLSNCHLQASCHPTVLSLSLSLCTEEQSTR